MFNNIINMIMDTDFLIKYGLIIMNFMTIIIILLMKYLYSTTPIKSDHNILLIIDSNHILCLMPTLLNLSPLYHIHVLLTDKP